MRDLKNTLTMLFEKKFLCSEKVSYSYSETHQSTWLSPLRGLHGLVTSDRPWSPMGGQIVAKVKSSQNLT